MDPTGIEGEGTSGLDRRSVLKRGAILGGAMVWTVPAVQTLAGPAFAAGTACVPDLVLSITVDGTRTCISKTTYNDPSGGTPGQCCDCYSTVLPGVIDAIGADGAGPIAVALCQLQGDCVATTTGC